MGILRQDVDLTGLSDECKEVGAKWLWQNRELGGRSPEQLHRVNLDDGGQAFQTLQCEVAFAAFEAAHVGPVDTDDVGEGFLGEAALLPVAAQVRADVPLEVAFHPSNGSGMILVGLQTYK